MSQTYTSVQTLDNTVTTRLLRRAPVREPGHNFWVARGHKLKRQYLRTARAVCQDPKLERWLKTPREAHMPSPRSGRLSGEREDVRNRWRLKLLLTPFRGLTTADELAPDKKRRTEAMRRRAGGNGRQSSSTATVPRIVPETTCVFLPK